MRKFFANIMIMGTLFVCLFINCGDDNVAYAGGVDTVVSPTPEFANPIRYSSVDAFLAGVLGAVQKIVAGLAVLMIVVGGIMYITSAGGAQAEAGKKAVTAALIGLAIVLAGPSFLKEIYTILGGQSSGAVAGARSLSDIIISTIKGLLNIIGALSVLMLVVGGIMYITSAGSDRAETGRKIVVNAIIGLVVAILSLVMVTAIASVF